MLKVWISDKLVTKQHSVVRDIVCDLWTFEYKNTKL